MEELAGAWPTAVVVDGDTQTAEPDVEVPNLAAEMNLLLSSDVRV